MLPVNAGEIAGVASVELSSGKMCVLFLQRTFSFIFHTVTYNHSLLSSPLLSSPILSSPLLSRGPIKA